jgi:predicted ATPase
VPRERYRPSCPCRHGFVGREQELARLHELAEIGTTVVIEGVGGVGKTALAVRFAHQLAHRYPDGQLWLNLRGFDPRSEPACHPGRGTAFASASNPSASRELPDLSALFHSLLTGKRVLVLLDNAVSAAEVRPLLPGTAGCLVVVTNRHRLGGLVAGDSARRLTLDVLAEAEAADLLAQVVGTPRVWAERGAAARIARLCDLPLALRIVADRVGRVPGPPLPDLAGRLAGRRMRAPRFPGCAGR